MTFDLGANVQLDEPSQQAVMSAEEAGMFSGLIKSPAPSERQPIKSLNYSHDGMIDLIVANPGITQNEIARQLGYSVSWISQVINSDAFQSRLADRKTELVDPIITATLDRQFEGILSRSLELTRERLAAETVSDNFILRSAELSSRALGYGAKRDEAPKTNLDEKLTDLASNLVGLLRKGKREPSVFEGEAG